MTLLEDFEVITWVSRRLRMLKQPCSGQWQGTVCRFSRGHCASMNANETNMHGYYPCTKFSNAWIIAGIGSSLLKDNG